LEDNPSPVSCGRSYTSTGKGSLPHSHLNGGALTPLRRGKYSSDILRFNRGEPKLVITTSVWEGALRGIVSSIISNLNVSIR